MAISIVMSSTWSQQVTTPPSQDSDTGEALKSAAPAVAKVIGTATQKAKSKAKPFDPTAVHPAVAVRQPVQREINLPGVMRIEGAKELLSSNKRTIIATGQSLHTVYLSKNDSNLVVTPFPKPMAIFTKGLAMTHVEGNNVFVNIEDATHRPFMIWLKDEADSANVIGLQVTPKKSISAQLVTLVLEGKVGNSGAMTGPNDPRQTAIAEKLGHLAQGKKPQGYAVDDASGYSTVAKNALTIKPLRRFSSSNDDIWEYAITNASAAVAVVSKTDFCSGGTQGECDPSILAVSIFPVDTLAPGQRTRAYVVVAKGRSNGGTQ